MFSSVIKIIKLSVEYKDALQAAIDKAQEGSSAAEVIRTFAENTGTELDDKAVEALIAFVDELREKLPLIDASKDELLAGLNYYCPLIRDGAHEYIDKAESNLPSLLTSLRKLLETMESRFSDIENLFSMADVAIDLFDQHLKSLTKEEDEPGGT